MKTTIVTARRGHKVKLSKIDPNDTGGCAKTKALEKFCQLREKISQLQEILYAEHRRSLLLIFQAMDTGGKDGAIKNLCAGLNPPGFASMTSRPRLKKSSLTIFSGARTRRRQERE